MLKGYVLYNAHYKTFRKEKKKKKTKTLWRQQNVQWLPRIQVLGEINRWGTEDI